jgi:hypothetical protein
MRAYLVVLMLGSGLGILSYWGFTVATRRAPQAQGMAMRFHIGAEVLLAVLLIAAGIGLLVKVGPVQLALAGTALGALAYTAVNSPGYYVEPGGPVIVWAFAALLILAGLGIVFVLVMA